MSTIWPVDPAWEEQQQVLLARETKQREIRERQERIYHSLTSDQLRAAMMLLQHYDVEFSKGAVLLAHQIMERLEHV